VTARQSWEALKAGTVVTIAFVALGAVVSVAFKWLGTDQSVTDAVLLILGLLFLTAALFTWFAGMADVLKRTGLTIGRRAVVFGLLLVGNFVGAIIYRLAVGPHAPDQA
jgi:predicted transporter